jgi:hypothetical protein
VITIDPTLSLAKPFFQGEKDVTSMSYFEKAGGRGSIPCPPQSFQQLTNPPTAVSGLFHPKNKGIPGS